MEIKKEKRITESIKLSVVKDGKEVGRAFLCLFKNDLHNELFGLMEDVFVDEQYRSQGIGTELVNEVVKEAKNQKCYKLIATSRYERPKVHELYLRLGFKDRGKEFRMDF